MRCLDGITNSMGMSVTKFRETVKDREPGVLQFMELQRVGYNLTTDNNNLFTIIPFLHIFVTSDFLCLLQRCCCVNALAHLCLCAGVKTHLG